MEGLHNQVFFPTTMADLFSSWARCPDAVPYAGGTDLILGQGGRSFLLPRNIISLAPIEELRRISRTERYLEIGAAVTLAEIFALGKIVPEILRSSLSEIANPQVRNIATIGGSLCCRRRRLDVFAPLAVLDARLELRTATTSRWVSVGRFAPESGEPLLEKAELLTRIRVPLESWNYNLYTRIGGIGIPTEDSASFSFIARAENDILSEVRLALAGMELIRDRSIENTIVGKSLPLTRKHASGFHERWRDRLNALNAPYPADLLRDRFLNLVEQAVMGLAE
ncbi:MAG: FAD binding domain-containing protein [Treponemataceae bacterium]